MFWDVAMCQNSWVSSYWLNDDLVINESMNGRVDDLVINQSCLRTTSVIDQLMQTLEENEWIN